MIIYKIPPFFFLQRRVFRRLVAFRQEDELRNRASQLRLGCPDRHDADLSILARMDTHDAR